jgi:hypothetical protein
MKEEEDVLPERKQGVSSFSDNQKTLLMTYLNKMIDFKRNLPQEVKSKLDVQEIMQQSDSKETQEVQQFTINLFQTFFDNFLPAFRGSKILYRIGLDYINSGTLGNSVEFDFYHILNNLIDPIYQNKIVETIHKIVPIEPTQLRAKKNLELIKCFLSNVLSNALIKPESSDEQGKNYKENYIHFLKNPFLPNQDDESSTKKSVKRMLCFIAGEVYFKKLINKCLVNFDPIIPSELRDTTTILSELQDITTILSELQDITKILFTSNDFSTESKNELKNGFQSMINLCKSYVSEDCFRDLQNIVTEAEQNMEYQRLEEKIKKSKKEEKRKINAITRNPNIGQPNPEDIENRIRWILVTVGTSLIIGSVLLNLQKNPHYFTRYPFLRRILPFLAPKAPEKPSFLQRIFQTITNAGTTRSR